MGAVLEETQAVEGAEEGQETTGPQQAAQRRPDGTLTPAGARQAALVSAEKRREKKAEREAAAEWDALTVGARWATVLAKTATAGEMEGVVKALISTAKEGGQKGTMAARVLLDAVHKAGGRGDEPVPEGSSFEDLTPAQREATRAVIERRLAEIAQATGESPAQD